MHLNLNDHVLPFKIIDTANVDSKHSSRELQRFKVEVMVSGEEDNQKILSLIEIAKQEGCTSVDENDENNILKLWKIKGNSYSYNNNSPFYTHNLEIEEVELLEVSSLEVGEIVFEPYFFEEYFLNDLLNVRAKTIINKQQQSLIIDMINREIPVIRHGIDEHPRQMILSLGLWSETDANIKHEIILMDVDTSNNLNKNRMGEEFRLLVKASFQAAENQALLDLLLSTLINKNILSEEEVSKLRDDASEQLINKLYNFYKVEDIDA